MADLTGRIVVAVVASGQHSEGMPRMAQGHEPADEGEISAGKTQQTDQGQAPNDTDGFGPECFHH